MTYQSITEMAASESLRSRITAAVAEEGFPDDPVSFVGQNIWHIVAAGNWDAQWDSARASASVNVNPDTGARDDVITDPMILSVIQPMMPEPEAE